MASASFASKFHTTTRGTKTHYLQTGDKNGKLVICLHGLGGSVNTFTSLVEFLPDTYNIVLVDFPGFGQTPLRSKTEPLVFSDYVPDLHDLVTFLQAGSSSVEGGKVIFIGHSLGTIVALHYTAQYPSSVAGLALLGTGRSAAHIPAVRQRMLDLASSTRKDGIEVIAEKSLANNFPLPEQRAVPPENLEEGRKAVAASGPEGYARTCEMIVDPSHVDPDYSKVTCPAVLVAGDLDIISPPQRSEDISSLLGGPSWVQVVKSGHQPLIDDTEATVSAILQLLQKV